MGNPAPVAPGSAVIAQPEGLITVPLESVPTDVPLFYPVYLKVNNKFVLFRNAGDILTRDRAGQLDQYKVDAVYVAKADLLTYVDSLKAGLDEIGINGGSETAGMGLRHLLYSYWKVMETYGEIKESTFANIKEMTTKVPISIAKSRELAVKLLRRAQEPTLYFANHSVNVSLYSVAIGLKMRLPEDQLSELALAGMVSNIGIIKIAKEVLYKPAPLTPEERKIIERHPLHGEEILKMLFAPPTVIHATGQHHEWINGSGYPRGLKGEEISLLARIVSIAEVYDALISDRPWGAANPPSKAVGIMAGMEGRFDPKILDLAVK